MPSSGRVRLLFLVCALASAFAAGAEATQRPTYGEELVVEGTRSRPVAPGDPTAAATIVDADRFAGESKTVAELVGTSPGVVVHEYGGLGQLATVSIRGSTADQVLVFLDGLPLNSGAGGGVDLSRIPRSWIERIEVIRGAEGARYAAGALGGVVNIVTRRAVTGEWAAEATGGSFETGSASANVAAGGDRWGLLAAGSVDATSGRFEYLFDPTPALAGDALETRTRDHNASFNAGGLLKGWAALGDGRLDAVLLATGGHRDLPGSPYQPTPADGQRSTLLGTNARFSHPLSRALTLAVEGGARDDYLSVWIAPFPGARQRDTLLTGTAELAWTAGPSTAMLRMTGTTERLFVDTAPDHDRDGFAVGLSEDLSIASGMLRIAPAVRWDAQGPFHGVSASVGTTWRVSGPWSVRAGVARTFRPPSFAELYLSQGLLSPNPDLVPETGWSADAGVAADGRFGLAAITVFAHSYEDLIVYEPDSFRRLKPFNDSKAQAEGFEVELASAPVGPFGIVASAAYTYLDTETLRGPEGVVGKDLPHRARHRLFARLAGGPSWLTSHVEAHSLSEQFQDVRNSPSLRVPPALTFNAGGSLRLVRAPETRLGVELRNVLDDRSLQDGFGNPLPGRMVMVTLRVSGGKEPP